MREIRQSGSEGGGAGNSTGSPYPYRRTTWRARVGYWLRHVAEGTFTYDMGARVSAGSPLYHRVHPGPDLQFASSAEFDRGPHRGP